MNKAGRELLMAEYDRLKAMELHCYDQYERVVQFHTVLVTAVSGLLVLFPAGQDPLTTEAGAAQALLGVVLVFGVVTFLRLVNVDAALCRHGKAYEMIRAKFLESDPTLRTAFRITLLQDRAKFEAWSSPSGIVERALTVSQHKTVVALANAIVSAHFTILAAKPDSRGAILLLGAGAVAVVGALHVTYASWRYKRLWRRLEDSADRD